MGTEIQASTSNEGLGSARIFRESEAGPQNHRIYTVDWAQRAMYRRATYRSEDKQNSFGPSEDVSYFGKRYAHLFEDGYFSLKYICHLTERLENVQT